MSKKLERLVARRRVFVELAKSSRLYCEKHKLHITPYRLLERGCYIGNHGTSICPYIHIINRKV